MQGGSKMGPGKDIKDILILASPIEAGRLIIPNRLVAQPMERSAGTEQGALTPALVQEYLDLARGQWGVLHVEAMSVTPAYKSRKGQLVISKTTRADISALLGKMRAIAPTTAYVLQLTVPGVVAGEGLPKTTIIPGVHAADPSIKLFLDKEIEEILESFKLAIDVGIEAGVDGIDIKACHGYLGVEFLRPANNRPGNFGGSFENRTRWFKEIVSHARRAARDAGKDRFLLGSRISVAEYIPGGVGTAGPGEYIEDLTEVQQFAARLCDWGANFVNVTAGIPATVPEITRPTKNVPWGIYIHFRLTKAIKNYLAAEGKHPLVMGSAYTMLGTDLPRHAAKNIQDGVVDLIGLGRQVLADPCYPAKLFSGKTKEIDLCTGCSSCAQLLRQQKHVGCVHYNPLFKNALKS
jgi:2,4-dienoyl-CoA reductase-like NADH-dependent reductase (Old Yellow Enzyme family)